MRGNTILRTVLTLAVGSALAFPGAVAMAATPDPVAGDAGLTPTGKPAPVLVVSEYETSKDRLTVGTPFKLSLHISNKTARTAENVVVSLAGADAGSAGTADAPGGGLTVLGTGNAKYLGKLSGNRTETVSFRVVAGPGTPAGAMTVPVTISFEHGGERHDSAYTIGLVFERDAVLSVATAELPKTARVDEPFDASFELANAGSFTLPGTTISVEAKGAAVKDSSVFVGAFEAAAAETIDVQITPSKAGPLDVVLVATYRDDFGREKTYRSVHVVQVQGKPKPVPGATDDAEKPKEKGNWFTRFLRALFGLGS